MADKFMHFPIDTQNYPFCRLLVEKTFILDYYPARVGNDIFIRKGGSLCFIFTLLNYILGIFYWY